MLGKLQFHKYHKVFREISVGLETAFSCPQSALVWTHYSAGLSHKLVSQMIHFDQGQEPGKVFTRVYNPAYIISEENITLYFVPLVNETCSLFHRFCLRHQAIEGTDIFSCVAFARFGEEEAFRFRNTTGDTRYLALDFLGKSAEFVPLYMKIEDGNRDLYFRFTAELLEDPERGVLAVAVEVTPVAEDEAPEHLKKYSFDEICSD